MLPHLLWLPGLDGLDGLHWAAVHARLTPEERDVSRFVALPPGRLGYAELEAALAPTLPSGPTVLIGESFSGPLALRLARHTPDLRGVVLVASFAAPPLPLPSGLVGAAAPWVLRLPPPAFVLRRYLIGLDASDHQVAETRALMNGARPDDMAWRLRASLTEDATEALRAVRAPVAYLRPRQDGLVPASALAHVRAVRPDVQVAEIDGPHLILQHRAADALAALRPWWTPRATRAARSATRHDT